LGSLIQGYPNITGFTLHKPLSCATTCSFEAGLLHSVVTKIKSRNKLKVSTWHSAWERSCHASFLIWNRFRKIRRKTTLHT